MLDTQDTEFGVQLGGRAYRPVRREGSYIKALGTRIGCRVDERMAAQYHTIGVHKLSCWVEMQFRKTQHCYKSTVVPRRRFAHGTCAAPESETAGPQKDASAI